MYSNQRGGGLDVYRGVPVQRGRGFSSLLGGLKNVLIPLAKSGVKAARPILRKAGRVAVRQGKRQLVNVVKDISRGKPLRKSVVSRVVKPTVKAVERQLLPQSQPRKRTKRKGQAAAAQRIKQVRNILA